MPIRAKEIAKKLGVSETTVSLVLNNKPGVGDKTRKRVLQAISTMGYDTNIKIKANDVIKNIRFILFKCHGLVVGDTPFFSKLIEGIEGEARRNGYNIIVSYINRETNNSEYIKELNEDINIDGIIILATEMNEEDISIYSDINIPLLVIDNCFYNLPVDCVQIDNIEGVTKAMQYLFDCGHRDIGYLHSSAVLYNFQERLLGYKAALEKNNLIFDKEKLISIEPTIEGSYRDMQKYIKMNTRIPKALFADNDILAMGATRALKESGYRLPDDISIVGFDDMPYCIMMRPMLSTIRVSNERMGIIAVRRLVEKINKNTDETVKILVRTQIIKRDSVKEV